MGLFATMNASSLRLLGIGGLLVAVTVLAEFSVLAGLFMGAGSALVFYGGAPRQVPAQSLRSFGTLTIGGILFLVGLGVGFGG